MNVAGAESGISELIEHARDGDAGAINAILEKTSHQLVKLTRLMFRAYPGLRRWEMTDDVFQLAMMRVSKEISAVNPASTKAFTGFVALQIRRTLVDLARKHSRRIAIEADGNASPDGKGRTPIDRADNSTRPETLMEWANFHDSIERMPQPEREVFSRRWYAGMSQLEIAQALGISVPTVKRRWLRARCFVFDAMGGCSPNEAIK